MLGRYIAGTLLILGAAMMVAPESPQRPETPDVAVARTETSPVTLATTEPDAMAAAVSSAADTPQEAVVKATMSTRNLQSGVEAALVQALALDATEEAAEAELSAAEARQDRFEVTLAAAKTVEEPAPEAAEPKVSYVFVTGSKVNVRAGPSTQYRVVGSVVKGDPVELVSDEGNGWARIKIENGEKTGFMASKFLADAPTGG